MYITIDKNGDPVDFPIDDNNMYHIMGNTFDFTEQEALEKGFAVLVNGENSHAINGHGLADITRGSIVKNADGSIEQLWNEEEIDNAEKRNRWVEGKRHNLLYLCDWTQSPDSPLSAADKESWKIYRQALRDVPNVTDFNLVKSSDDIAWPVVPGTPEAPAPE